MIVPFFIMFSFLFPRKNSQRVNYFLVTGLGFFFRKSFQVQTDPSAPVCVIEFHFKLLKNGLLFTVHLFTLFRCLKEHFPSGCASNLRFLKAARLHRAQLKNTAKVNMSFKSTVKLNPNEALSTLYKQHREEEFST